MVYSNEGAIKRALQEKIRKAILQVKSAENNPCELNLEHPSFRKDAQNNNYVALKAHVTKKFEKHQEQNRQRRLKLGERK